MFRDGTYAAWFKTPLAQGTAIVHFADGKLWGRDSIVFYDGTYETAGNRFSANFTVRRHTEGHPTVFGIDDLDMTVEGIAGDKITKGTGTTPTAPGVVVEFILIPSQSPESIAQLRPVSNADLGKLPKLARRSR